MKIVINSHVKSNIALNHLIESMEIQEEYKEFEIIIFIGGYYDLKKYEIEKRDHITYIKCNHNSIDFTGLIGLAELFIDDVNQYYIYLHDTCQIGNKFYKIIKSLDLTNVSTIKIKKYDSMNIGIYSQKIINDFRVFLILSSKNTEENRLMEFKNKGIDWEDYIFKKDPNNIVLNNLLHPQLNAPTDYYKTGVQRIVEYFPNLDLYKIKANWGAPGQKRELNN